ncbi:MAG: exopolyphosphatase [Rhodospirillales bacterium 70-18]|nr:Ppx/GppA family phosphatase [Rhodospirillales bacterium]OJY73567.1 MAG: exopolyphosphatase [Rhodospirillales bacterium 70-18]
MVEDAATSGSEKARTAPPAFAAVDLGTNNCRLLVGAPAGEGFRVLDSFSRIVRLGEGLQHSGQLSPTAMDRALAALHGCAQRLARRPLRGLRAIATEACRQAANGAEFLDRVRRETGLPIGVISTREEVELALESCAPLLAGDGRRALLFDIGGGSTELAWVRLADCDPGLGVHRGGPELIGYVSLPVGVVTLAERFGAAADTEDGFAAMVEDVAARLRGFESVHCIGHEIRQGGVRLLGTSGTVTTLAGIVMNLPRYSRPAVDGAVLLHREAAEALERLRALGREGLALHPCVGPERAEFVLPGCAIFAAIQRTWPAPQVVVADRGLREGMLLRMIRAERSGARRSTGRADGGAMWRESAMARGPVRG